MSIDDTLARIVRDEVRAALEAVRTDEEQLLLSVEQAARRLDVSDDTIRELITAHEIDVVDGIGRGLKVVASSLREYVARRSYEYMTGKAV